MRERGEGYITEFDGESKMSDVVDGDLFPSQINDAKWEYLLKINDLCRESGAELILVTTPTLQYPWASGGWNTEKSALMKERAAAEGITYIDLACDYDLVDYTTDSFDGGIHMNCRGMEKVTRFIGEYLKTKITPSGSNALYDEMTELYDKAMDVAMLESETNFFAYVDRLAQRLDRSTVFITAREEYTYGMTADDYTFLRDRLGLKVAQDGTFAESYMAVIDKGELLYEALSNREIKHSMEIGDLPISLCSSGYHSKPAASVKIDETEYAQGGRGLNIVVYDNESGLVIDSVSFDTYQEDKPASRNYYATDTYLRAYEAKVCFGENAA